MFVITIIAIVDHGQKNTLIRFKKRVMAYLFDKLYVIVYKVSQGKIQRYIQGKGVSAGCIYVLFLNFGAQFRDWCKLYSRFAQQLEFLGI